jgi:hypothetical protein
MFIASISLWVNIGGYLNAIWNPKICNAPKIYQVLGFIFELWMPWNV